MNRSATVAFVGLQHPHSLAIHLSLQNILEVSRLITVEPDAAFRNKVSADATYESLDDLFAHERPHVCFVMLPPDEAPILFPNPQVARPPDRPVWIVKSSACWPKAKGT